LSSVKRQLGKYRPGVETHLHSLQFAKIKGCRLR
jgi:hypothetical protein